MHTIVDALAWPGFASAGDGSFKVDDACIRPGVIEDPECVSPDIGIVHRAANGAVNFLGQRNVFTRIPDPGLI
jgi:hypothetical protein